MAQMKQMRRSGEPAKGAVAPNPLKRAALVSLAFASASSVFMLVVAAERWLSPSAPMLWMWLASAPIAALSTLVALSEAPRAELRHALGPALVALVVSAAWGGALGQLWHDPEVRSATLSWATERGWLAVLERAVERDDGLISQRACKALVTSRDEAHRLRGFEALARSPVMFDACFEGGDQELQRAWGRRLVDRWVADMSQPDGAGACAASALLGQATAQVPGATSALLACVVTEGRAEVSMCCARELKEQGLTEGELARVVEQESDRTHEERMRHALLPHAFEAPSLSSKTLGIDSVKMRRYALRASCRRMGVDDMELASRWYEMSIKQCGLRARELEQDTPLWVDLCVELPLGLDARQEEHAHEVFCELLTARMTARAARAASTLLVQATRSRYNLDALKDKQMLGSIHGAARQSGFRGDDSTGLVGEFEGYGMEAGTRERGALHLIGQRSLKATQHRVTKEDKVAIEQAAIAKKRRDKLSAKERVAYDKKLDQQFNLTLGIGVER